MINSYKQNPTPIEMAYQILEDLERNLLGKNNKSGFIDLEIEAAKRTGNTAFEDEKKERFTSELREYADCFHQNVESSLSGLRAFLEISHNQLETLREVYKKSGNSLKDSKEFNYLCTELKQCIDVHLAFGSEILKRYGLTHFASNFDRAIPCSDDTIRILEDIVNPNIFGIRKDLPLN